MTLKVAIAGATGYTGGELLRLLSQHPHVEVVSATSEQSAGEPLVHRLPSLKGYYDLTLESFDPKKIAEKADLVFLALSHTKAMEPARQLIDLGKRVIDLSADFRLRSAPLYERWYKLPHSRPELLKEAVYGLTEIYRDEIAKSFLIANPGCYPTGALLLLSPFLKAGCIDPSREIIIDSKSGVSGAGRTPSAKAHFAEVNEGMVAYNVGVHRHLPEIEQEIRRIGKQKMTALFTPYLLPVNRGILTTIYLPLKEKFTQKKIDSVLDLYRGEPFIRRFNDAPNLNQVRGSNFCDIGAFATPSGRTAILMSAIDNLVKGASGQAIQNMNVMMGWDERLGLMSPGIFP
ncbi:MAG: N-acetyl-gamma-glutamyl-phosphate reductase [Candidatus Manganitrophus sp. SA1]|nr:N-acetyl-gamma-glutamyl-phosphate reductase [Candidatus Manganitrophus morganii]